MNIGPLHVSRWPAVSLAVGGVGVGISAVKSLSNEYESMRLSVEIHPLNICWSLSLVGRPRVSYWRGDRWPARDEEGRRLPLKGQAP